MAPTSSARLTIMRSECMLSTRTGVCSSWTRRRRMNDKPPSAPDFIDRSTMIMSGLLLPVEAKALREARGNKNLVDAHVLQQSTASLNDDRMIVDDEHFHQAGTLVALRHCIDVLSSSARPNTSTARGNSKQGNDWQQLGAMASDVLRLQHFDRLAAATAFHAQIEILLGERGKTFHVAGLCPGTWDRSQ